MTMAAMDVECVRMNWYLKSYELVDRKVLPWLNKSR